MTKRSPLAPGDKVVFYNNGFRYHGEVVRLYTAGKIQVRSINGNEYDIHEKQVRRLIPKPRKEKQERVRDNFEAALFRGKEVYLQKPVADYVRNMCKFPLPEPAEFKPKNVWLVEMFPGETICPAGSVSVSRMQVINAWGNLDSGPGDLEKLLKQLGLPKEGA